MKIEVRSGGGPQSPGREFRKWVAIGAVGGAALLGVAGVLGIALIMLGGAFFGALAGALVGAVQAVIAMFRRR